MYDVLTQVQSLREQLHRPRFRENGRRKQRVPVELQKVTDRFFNRIGPFFSRIGPFFNRIGPFFSRISTTFRGNSP